MTNSSFLFQHKQTGKKYHRISLAELDQLRSDAIQEDKVPIYMVEFDGYPHPFYIIGQSQFTDLEDMYNA